MKKILLLTICTVGFLFAGNGKTIFDNTCAACHGKNAELKPLGKNEIIRGMSESKIIRELRKMKNEHPSSDSKKRLMQKEAKLLSDEEIKSVAKYIITL